MQGREQPRFPNDEDGLDEDEQTEAAREYILWLMGGARHAKQ